jgi:hypothetical protein
MLAHQARVVQIGVFDNGLIAPRDLLRAFQQPEVAMVQNVLFLLGKLTAFDCAHAESLKKLPEDVPPTVLTSFHKEIPADEQPRPLTASGAAILAARRNPQRFRINNFPGSCLMTRFISKPSRATLTVEGDRPLWRITSSTLDSSRLSAS